MLEFAAQSPGIGQRKVLFSVIRLSDPATTALPAASAAELVINLTGVS